MAGGSDPACPAGKQTLRTTSLAGVSVRVCGHCHATLLAQLDMIPLLEAMSLELLKTFDPDTNLGAVRQGNETVACPACSREMARDDYCGAGLAHFHRCEACGLLWLGKEELGTMTLMWARMETRLQRAQKVTQQALDEAEQFVTAVQLGDHIGAPRLTKGAFGYALGETVGRILSLLP